MLTHELSIINLFIGRQTDKQSFTLRSLGLGDYAKNVLTMVKKLIIFLAIPIAITPQIRYNDRNNRMTMP